jgi:hypothetical protein
MGRTGEMVRRITRMGFRPTWSADGTAIAFVTENVELYLAALTRSFGHTHAWQGGRVALLPCIRYVWDRYRRGDGRSPRGEAKAG